MDRFHRRALDGFDLAQKILELGTITYRDAATVDPGSGPRHLAFAPQHHAVYVLNEMACTVTAFHYDGQKDIAALAAAYAFGLARNHPFVDGNKRMAFMAVGVFLVANGWRLEAGAVEAVQAMTALARGEIDESHLAAWLKRNTKRG